MPYIRSSKGSKMQHELTSSEAIQLRRLEDQAKRTAIDLIVELGNDSLAQGMVASAFLSAAIMLLENATPDDNQIDELIRNHRRERA